MVLPGTKRSIEAVTEEVDVVQGAKVRVTADGRIRFIKVSDIFQSCFMISILIYLHKMLVKPLKYMMNRNN